ncbi:MAG: SecDF P1 head subdomain-containing protein [Candidatus Brocadiia bacterium]
MLISLFTVLLGGKRLRAHEVPLRLVGVGGKTPTADQTQKAALVLKKRMDALKKRLDLRDFDASALSPGKLQLQFRSRKNREEILYWLTLSGHAEFCLLYPGSKEVDAVEMKDPPEGYEGRTYRQYYYSLSKPGDKKKRDHHYLVCNEPLIRIDEFEEVLFATKGLHKRSMLTFRFKAKDAERFTRATARNLGRKMVLIIDERLYLPPKEIGAAIEGNLVQIQGYFFNPPLRNLVKVLNAGAVPGRLEIVADNTDF